MRLRFNFTLLVVVFFLASLVGCAGKQSSRKVVAIQPVGNVSKTQIEIAKVALDSVYRVKVIVLKTIEPPAETFVNIKTPRYRADKLIAWLKDQKADSVDYIMGLTGYDISVSKTDGAGNIKEPKSRYEDFGIFGLGYRPGNSCVVSYFRLGEDTTKMKDRLSKICVHELGHNLGLPHCENKSCVMTDAVEKISSIDNARLKLCEKCYKKIVVE